MTNGENEDRSRCLPSLAPLAVLAMLAIAFFVLGGDHLISLESLRQHNAVIAWWVAVRPVQSMLIYLALYMLGVGCGLPIGVAMMLSAGYLFGPIAGAGLAVLAATGGGMILFVVIQTASADRVSGRIRRQAEEFRSGFQRNEFGYLLVLRLLPVLPFFAVTIIAAIAEVSRPVFLLATLLGVMPISLAWAVLGTDLEQLLQAGASPGLGDLLQAQILLPVGLLTALLLCPLLLRHWRSRLFGVELPR